MTKQNKAKGLIFLATAAVVWGFAFVAQRLGADSMPAFYFNFSRYLLGTLSLIPLILIFERNATDHTMIKNSVVVGIVAGIVLALASYFQQIGIEMTDSAGKSGFITGLYMVLVPIFGIFLKKKTTGQTWIGAVLGVGGLFLICMDGGQFTFTLGDLVLLVSAMFFATHILIIDTFGQKMYSLRFAMTQFAACTMFNFVGMLIFDEPTLPQLQAALIPVLYCGLMSVGVAYTCQVLGQKYSEPTSASIILSTEAVFSAIGGAIILNEKMSAPAYIGCVLIFGGILLSQVKFKRKAK
ncbi:MAG: DMT family transporter [Clostridia bacterium]|nr:DMT family transporter [Clostridia bacterium]